MQNPNFLNLTHNSFFEKFQVLIHFRTIEKKLQSTLIKLCFKTYLFHYLQVRKKHNSIINMFSTSKRRDAETPSAYFAVLHDAATAESRIPRYHHVGVDECSSQRSMDAGKHRTNHQVVGKISARYSGTVEEI